MLNTTPKTVGIKDAVHVPIISIICDVDVYPGDGIYVYNGEAYPNDVHPTGIVNPFAKGCIPANTPFWLLLMPGSVDNVRHDWNHESFNVGGKTFEEYEDVACKIRGC